MMPYFLYILFSPKLDKYYIGVSHDPDMRLYYHNRAEKGWTRRGRPWKLVFKKEFPDKLTAMRWERWLKKQKDKNLV